MRLHNDTGCVCLLKKVKLKPAIWKTSRHSTAKSAKSILIKRTVVYSIYLPHSRLSFSSFEPKAIFRTEAISNSNFSNSNLFRTQKSFITRTLFCNRKKLIFQKTHDDSLDRISRRGWTALYQGRVIPLMKRNDWVNHFREPSTQFR